MGAGESKKGPPPGATVESAQDHLRDVRVKAAHVQQLVRDKRAAIYELRRLGRPRSVLRDAIARLRPFEAQLSHLQMCIERLESSVIGIQTHRLNRETMSVMRNLSRFGTLSEREMEAAASTLDDMDAVAMQHEELGHIVHQAGAAMSGADAMGDDDVEAFFAEDAPAAFVLPSVPSVPSVPGGDPAPEPEPEPEPEPKAKAKAKLGVGGGILLGGGVTMA